MARRPSKTSPELALLDEFDEAIEVLKVKYDRYFYGVDRVVPARDRDRVERMLRELMRHHYRSTMLRYRYAQLKQRFTTYQHHWNRILGEIERGTYRRVVAESGRREREAQMAARAQAAAHEQPDASPPSKPTRGQPPPLEPKPKLPDGMQAQEARALFNQFVQAKKAAGENVNGLTYGGLVQKLARELPKLQARHGTNVRFEVATVDGKIKLRARGGRST